VDGILQYPGPYAVSDPVKAQEAAVAQWMAGGDPAGRRIRDVRARTLVADGTVDQLDPVGNAWLLARAIRRAGAPLLCSDAGHAFLFQDEASFVPAVEHFLR
jgi:homoserine acetyltransferase